MPERLPYVPHEELSGNNPNAELAADICELSAFFSSTNSYLLSDLRNDLEIGGDEYRDVDAHNRLANEPIDAAANVIESREKLLGTAYPFELDDTGTELTYIDDLNWARSGYLLSLVLSHLKAISPVLEQADLEPSAADVRILRDWFQKISTPALAAELRGGTAWAFGHPRNDHLPFLEKLKSIWTAVKDGEVKSEAPIGAPAKVKDDEIDVIAARPHPDGCPGFPIAVAQVATGGNWTDKSLRGTATTYFFEFWFNDSPASQILVYHIVPFIIEKDHLRRHTLRLGNILHRLRLAALLSDAETGVAERRIDAEGIEVFELLGGWLANYKVGEVPNAA